MKYIVDLKDNCNMIQQICVTENGNAYATYVESTYVHYLEELNSDYINEHYGRLQDEAYQKGFEDGKAVHDKGCAGCKYAGKVVTGPPCISCCNSYKNQWTAKLTDDEIKVGDEVKHDGGHIFIVTAVGEIGVCGIDGDGDLKHASKCNVHRTGRHFDIQKILEEMKNE